MLVSGASWAMTTAVDTNVIVALWDRDPSLSSAAQSALDAALGRGTLVVAATVFAELMAAPSCSKLFLDSFFRETGINIDWALDESVWRTAGRALQGYAARRRKQRDVGPRRILADFLIGAHAQEGGHSLLTLDDHLYRTAFPDLTMVRVQLLSSAASNSSAVMHSGVAYSTKSNQVLLRVVTGLAAKCLVVHFKIRHRATTLASPTVST